jgi:hypothetical protein
MTTNEDPKRPTLEDNPGLEHDSTSVPGELMTASGSKIADPNGRDSEITLEDNPGLEHDEATEEGKPMTASGSTHPEDDSSRKV